MALLAGCVTPTGTRHKHAGTILSFFPGRRSDLGEPGYRVPDGRALTLEPQHTYTRACRLLAHNRGEEALDAQRHGFRAATDRRLLIGLAWKQPETLTGSAPPPRRAIPLWQGVADQTAGETLPARLFLSHGAACERADDYQATGAIFEQGLTFHSDTHAILNHLPTRGRNRASIWIARNSTRRGRSPMTPVTASVSTRAAGFITSTTVMKMLLRSSLWPINLSAMIPSFPNTWATSIPPWDKTSRPFRIGREVCGSNPTLPPWPANGTRQASLRIPNVFFRRSACRRMRCLRAGLCRARAAGRKGRDSCRPHRRSDTEHAF